VLLLNESLNNAFAGIHVYRPTLVKITLYILQLQNAAKLLLLSVLLALVFYFCQGDYVFISISLFVCYQDYVKLLEQFPQNLVAVGTWAMEETIRR